jgi:hypothetical protein
VIELRRRLGSWRRDLDIPKYGAPNELEPIRRQVEASEGPVRKRWGNLKDGDLMIVIDGNKEYLIGRLTQEALHGLTKE